MESTGTVGAVSMALSWMGKGSLLAILRSVLSVFQGPVLWVALFCFRGDEITGTCFLPHLDNGLVSSIQATEN